METSAALPDGFAAKAFEGKGEGGLIADVLYNGWDGEGKRTADHGDSIRLLLRFINLSGFSLVHLNLSRICEVFFVKVTAFYQRACLQLVLSHFRN